MNTTVCMVKYAKFTLSNGKNLFKTDKGSSGCFFSMRGFRRSVSNIAHAESFGDQYVKQLKEFFCDKVKFTAQWEEAQGEEFSAQSLGGEEELKSQFTSYTEDLSFKISWEKMLKQNRPGE